MCFIPTFEKGRKKGGNVVVVAVNDVVFAETDVVELRIADIFAFAVDESDFVSTLYDAKVF